MKSSRFLGIPFCLVLFFFVTLPAFAHVVVTPKSAGIGSFQTFTVSVPTEKEDPTVGLRLLIPKGLAFVTPTVKSGWTITTKMSEGDTPQVIEIDWTSGSIPPGQRDEFSFSAQVPAQETTLIWKAYQTYEDGEVVSWTHSPSSNDEDTNPPYSVTTIKNDINPSPVPTEKADENSLRVISYAALALSLVAITLHLMQRRRN